MKAILRHLTAAVFTVSAAAPAAANDSFCAGEQGEPGGSFTGYAQLIYGIAGMTKTEMSFDAYSIGPEAGKHPLEVTQGHTLVKVVIDGEETYAMYNNETTRACDISKEIFESNRPANAPAWGIK